MSVSAPRVKDHTVVTEFPDGETTNSSISGISCTVNENSIILQSYSPSEITVDDSLVALDETGMTNMESSSSK
jgi:CCR4-NOT transcriptional regulation complex NOT5 subunit